jgi:hypothetical protein
MFPFIDSNSLFRDLSIRLCALNNFSVLESSFSGSSIRSNAAHKRAKPPLLFKPLMGDGMYTLGKPTTRYAYLIAKPSCHIDVPDGFDFSGSASSLLSCKIGIIHD